MQFAVAGSYVGSIYFMRHRSAFGGWRLELARIFAGESCAHELHPDGEGGVASCFFVA